MQLLLMEARPALVSAVLIAFARIFTELGAAVILGGNIRGQTRTLTTVIALEYSKGDDARAIAMGLILLVVALGINGFVHGAGVVARGGTHMITPSKPSISSSAMMSMPVADVGSFTLHADRLTVITGPNGSGKTTLLKTLAGLLPPLRGRIVPQLPPGAGGAVFVHSTPYLFAGTVRHNVRLTSRGDERRAREALRDAWR